MIGNKNAEKWTFDDVKDLFLKCRDLSMNEDYDFIGEVYRDAGVTRNQIEHLSTRFPELVTILKDVKNNCEVNCYKNTKKDNINTAAGIINLKSNHGWTSS